MNIHFFSGNGVIILESDAVVKRYFSILPDEINTITISLIFFIPVLQRKAAQKHLYSNYSQPR